jgi:asparaginyl-tRNA synthetase
MSITPLPTLEKVPLGQPITLRGWVSVVQPFKKFSFLRLRDGVGIPHTVQVVLPTEVGPAPLVESYVSLVGSLKALPPKAYSDRPFEFVSTKIDVLSSSDCDYVTRCPPDAGPLVRLEERHLHLRDARFARITKLRALFLRAMREHFEEKGTTEIVPPCFVGVKCEGGASMFSLKHPAADKGELDCYLTESSQFALELAVPSFESTYCIYPSFRAERSNTRRHLTEFLHAECEWSGVLTFEDHVAKLKELLTGILTTFLRVCETCRDGDLLKELELKERLLKLIEMSKEVVILSHADAIKYCREHEIYKDPVEKVHFGERDDIPEAQERQMIDKIGKIVFLGMFAGEHKSFYCRSDPKDPSRVWGIDVEVPGVGEVIGSSVREGDTTILLEKMKKQGLKVEDYKEYLDLRKYGFGHTSGMGLGVDRMLTWILDLYTIREVVTFPRYPGHLRP